MPNEKPETKRVKASEARQNFSQLINQVHSGAARVVVEKSGIPVAAIISAVDLARFEAFEARRREHFRVLEEIGDAFKDVPLDELEREVDRAVRQVREEMRVQRLAARQG